MDIIRFIKDKPINTINNYSNNSNNNYSNNTNINTNEYVDISSLICKHCDGHKINKYGKKEDGTQKYYCRDCKRTFTLIEDKRKKYTEEFKLEVIKWYLENNGIRSLKGDLKLIIVL